MRLTLLVLMLSLTGCGGADWPFVEQHEVTTGSFNGLTIGMSRHDTLAVATRLGAKVISPIPCIPFRISKANLAQMPVFRGVDGIRITYAQSAFENVYFSGGSVSSVERSPGASDLPPISVGTTVQSVREGLVSELRANSALVVTPIVGKGTADVLALNDISTAAEKMQAHQCWIFEVNSVAPAGATYALTFGSAGLQKILYRRARIRAD